MINVRYIDGKPECPDCLDGIILKEYPERPDPKKPIRWVLVCPVCEIRLFEIPEPLAKA